MNEFDKAVSSRITHQSTEEIKVPKTMVTAKVKRCRNWSAPGKDKICNYCIKTWKARMNCLEEFWNNSSIDKFPTGSLDVEPSC